MKRSTGIETEKPGMASSLSSVPPVCPSPRPLTIGTCTPQAATIGARQIETLSPTPPVECLSTCRPAFPVSFTTRPLSRMARVSAVVSFGVIPRRKIAIASALIW